MAVILMLIVVILLCAITGTDTKELIDNTYNINNIVVQEEKQTNEEIEYMFMPIPNGKTIQMIMMPKVKE